MRALPAVQREHQNAHVVIVGGDDVSYGSRPKDAKNWREKMLAEVGSQLDPTRTHFLGKVPYADYKRVLQVSSAHVYLTCPFVLSWSCLEAMATGCLMVASDTAPVREVLPDSRCALPVPFLALGALGSALTQALGSGLQTHSTSRALARHRADRLTRLRGQQSFLALLWASAAAPASHPTSLFTSSAVANNATLMVC